MKDLSLKRSGIHWFLLKTVLVIGESIIDYHGIYFPWCWVFYRYSYLTTNDKVTYWVFYSLHNWKPMRKENWIPTLFTLCNMTHPDLAAVNSFPHHLQSWSQMTGVLCDWTQVLVLKAQRLGYTIKSCCSFVTQCLSRLLRAQHRRVESAQELLDMLHHQKGEYMYPKYHKIKCV